MNKTSLYRGGQALTLVSKNFRMAQLGMWMIVSCKRETTMSPKSLGVKVYIGLSLRFRAFGIKPSGFVSWE